MITEDYVSFETAKLLKEKGYCNVSIVFYKENGELIHYKVPLNYKGISDTLGVFYEAPTLQMAMKWLREVHNIAIVLTPSMFWGKYNVTIYKRNNEYPFGFNEDSLISSYEEASEAAIKYCLENLI